MEQPLVSVLMTCYNREKYIGEAIESVLSSTYKNFELIIVDDGSKDATVEIATHYAGKDNRIFVYINEKNLGDYPNRNRAASYAGGKYLKYVDSDDKIKPTALEVFVSLMEAAPDAGFGLGAKLTNNDLINPIVLSPEKSYLSHYNGSGLFHNSPLEAILRRDAFEKVEGFNHIRMAGDFDMWHRMAKSFPVVLIPKNLVWHRTHNDQEMNFYHQFSKSYEDAESKYLTREDCPLNAADKKRIYRKIMKDRLVQRSKRVAKIILSPLFKRA